METPKDELQVVDHLTTPPTTTGTSFSQLLLADDDVLVADNQNPLVVGLDHHVDQTFSTSSLFSLHNTPKMLCFGGNYQNEIEITPQKSVITSSDSSSASASSCNYTNNTAFNNSLQKKRNGSGGQELGTRAGVGGQKGPKKTKADNPTSTGHAKKKEKLGERIAALQQLVSPFGKTDTASVLHEATGYIRFLHDQVQVLCSPYLQPSQIQFQNGDGDNNERGEENTQVNKDLSSRGLCLIPVGCTLHVAGSNGADFWSPATIDNNNVVSPSTTIAKQ
ncbi:transcription factor bHLH113-like isoform X3 [Vicia villosa]|uniref:transcription factor bHLH113-like isoform X3 n=1 Tax=Vicia villosa TaxID=3911 RepID=UPI00273B3069|nr:transcription factor bHLH113-like isoform X3 [Vicia villosa]